MVNADFPAKCIPQDLCAEKPALCALNDLLVYALRGVVHDDGAGLVVYFGVDAGVADQVDNPLFALVLGEAEACGEVPVVVSKRVKGKDEVYLVLT